MVDADPEELRRRLVEVEERLDRIGVRLSAGYGSDSDRDGWLLWLRQLMAQRDRLRAELGDPRANLLSPAGAPPADPAPKDPGGLSRD